MIRHLKCPVLNRFPFDIECRGPDNLVEFWDKCIESLSIFDPMKEFFVVICVTMKHKIESYHIVTIGILNEVLVHPREFFRPAIVDSAYAVIAIHNHPSNVGDPSRADIQVCAQLKEAGKVLDLPLLDFAIAYKVNKTTKITSLRHLGFLSEGSNEKNRH